MAHSSDTGPPSAVRRLRRPGVLARVGLAGAAFVLVGIALRSVAAPAGGGVIGAKLEYWRDHAREYDTLFLGSSHVLRAFVPAEFDRWLAQHGGQGRSFNFGVQAVHLIEARYLLHEILDRSSGRLRRVFFEYQWIQPQIDPQNAFLPRTVYWHDRESTALAMERCFHWGRELGPGFHYLEDESDRWSLLTVFDRALPPDLRAAEDHLGHLGMDLCLFGRGKDIAKGLLGRSHGQTARYGPGHGYLALEQEPRWSRAPSPCWWSACGTGRAGSTSVLGC